MVPHGDPETVPKYRRIRGRTEGVAETPQLIRIWVAYERQDPRERERVASEVLALKREDYGGEEVNWGQVEKDVRAHMRQVLKDLRKPLKPHPLMDLTEEEEETESPQT